MKKKKMPMFYSTTYEKNEEEKEEEEKNEKVFKMVSKSSHKLNLKEKFNSLEALFPPNFVPYSDKKNHPHYLNLYLMSKKFLMVQISSSTAKPQEMKRPYSEGFLITEEIFYIKEFLTSIVAGESLQVWLFQDKYKKKYVLKRTCIYFDVNNSIEENYLNLDKLIQDKYLEFSLMTLYNACPHSSAPIFFNIILVHEIQNIAIELIMNYGGENVSDFFPFNSPEVVFEFFSQMANAYLYLETYRLEHNDIKNTNVLIDNTPNVSLVKLIDFDIGNIQSMTCKTGKGVGMRGFSISYIAPELLLFKVSNTSDQGNMNPWKSQMYSLGVLILESLQFFPRIMNFSSFDDKKLTEAKYQEFINKLTLFKNSTQNSLEKNILTICEFCTSYNPDKRPSSQELVELLQYIQSNNSAGQDINLYYDNLRNSRDPSKKQILDYISFENSLLSKFEEDVSTIEYTLFQHNETNENSQPISKPINNIGNSFLSKIESRWNLLINRVSNFFKNIQILKIQNEELQKKCKLAESSVSEEKLKAEDEKQIFLNKIKLLEQKVAELEDELHKKDSLVRYSNKEIANVNSIQMELLNTSKKESLLNKDLIKVNECNGSVSTASSLNTNKISQNLNIEAGNSKVDNNDNITLFNKDSNRIKSSSLSKNQDHGNSIQSSENKKQNDKESLQTVNEVKVIDNYVGENEILSSKILQSEDKSSQHRASGYSVIITKNVNEKERSQSNISNINLNIKNEIIEGSKNTSELSIIEGHMELIPSIYEESFNFFDIFQKILIKKNLIKSIFIKPEELIEKIELKESFEILNYFQVRYGLDNIEKESKNSNIPFAKKINFIYSYKYSGQVKNNIPHGRGIIIFESGSVIASDFEEGKISNLTFIKLNNNDCYIGLFTKKRQEGIGLKFVNAISNLSNQNNKIFFGNFNNLQFQGYGKMIYEKNKICQGIYQGFWNKDKREGFGKYYYQNGDIYEGNWINDNIQGQGKLTTQEGAIYQGGWESGERSGYGTLCFQDGTQYTGNWKGNKKHGMGKFISSNGESYEGEYQNDIKEGKGKHKSRSGIIFEGMFVNGKPDSEGTRIWPDGTKFIGTFIGDLRNGNGIEYTPTGDKYEGQWKNGKKEGKFIFTPKSGKVKYMDYSDGVLMGEVCTIF